MYKNQFSINNLQWLMCHKSKSNQITSAVNTMFSLMYTSFINAYDACHIVSSCNSTAFITAFKIDGNYIEPEAHMCQVVPSSLRYQSLVGSQGLAHMHLQVSFQISSTETLESFQHSHSFCTQTSAWAVYVSMYLFMCPHIH